MVNYIKSILLLFSFFVFYHCDSNKNPKNSPNSDCFDKHEQKDNRESNSLKNNKLLEKENDRYLYKSINFDLSKIWIDDSLGCNNHRNLFLAKKLIIGNSLIDKSPIKFKEFFGKPNEQFAFDKNTYLIYYIETICNEGQLIEKSDKCWIKFDFIENKLKEVPEFFACE